MENPKRFFRVNKNCLFLLCVATMFAVLFFHWKAVESKKKIVNYSERSSVLDTISVFKETKVCNDLMDNNFTTYKLSSKYKELLPKMDEWYLKYKDPNAEGHTAQRLWETVLLHHIAKQPWVKTICETGFNYGHSSFNFLSANPSAKVYSFDLGNHGYASKMNKSLHTLFPDNRLHVTFGNSMKKVPEAISSGFLPRCDVVFVDGGHNYPVAKSDIYHLAMHTNDRNLILFDDHPTIWGNAFGKAWDELLSGSTLLREEQIDYEKIENEIQNSPSEWKTAGPACIPRRFSIKEVMRCSERRIKGIHYQRGAVVGTVIKVP